MFKGNASMKKRIFVAVSLIIILAMYLVPFYGLNGIIGPETLVFWVLISALYLVIAFIALRGDD